MTTIWTGMGGAGHHCFSWLRWGCRLVELGQFLQLLASTLVSVHLHCSHNSSGQKAKFETERVRKRETWVEDTSPPSNLAWEVTLHCFHLPLFIIEESLRSAPYSREKELGFYLFMGGWSKN